MSQNKLITKSTWWYYTKKKQNLKGYYDKNSDYSI